MNQIDFEFSLNDKVHITELNRDGRVVALWYGDIGTQYNIRYFDGGEAKTIYFFPDELKAISTKEG